MSDHYSILGLTKSATNAEIKAAYRRLVKIYHPDKNPNNPEAVVKFRAIQEAYDVLSHALSRTRYDNRFSSAAYSYESPFAQAEKKQQARTKKYTFTEEDLKRRQYYKEHYKQHNPKPKVNSEEQKKNFNEIKYIFISVPIAIALLFFIINIYNRGKEVKNEDAANTKALNNSLKQFADQEIKRLADSVVQVNIATSSEPYREVFGPAKIDKRTLQVLQVTNWANRDAVVCIVDAKTNKVVRHYFIQDNFNLYFEYLPERTYYLRNYLGSIGSFVKDKVKMKGSSVGMFAEKEQFQEYTQDTFTISLSKHDTIAKNILLIKDDKKNNLIESEKFFGL